jgi:anti-sigma regulatory factor (Ser/Thr protein kinase)
MIANVVREVELKPTAHAVGQARRFVVGVLAEWGYHRLVEDAELMVSELVTNAVLHVPDEPISVDIWQIGPCLFLNVWDRSPKPPEFLDPDSAEEHGRGLHIVETLSLATGHVCFPEHKVVWVLLDVVEDAYLPCRPGAALSAVAETPRKGIT